MKQERQTLPSTPPPPETLAEAVCAVVVAYFPDEGFAERLKNLLPQVGALVVVDNTPAQGYSQQFMSLIGNGGRIRFIENHRNVGIAAALNQGLEHALQVGCTWLLTLDQDTWCYPDMVTTLLQVHEACEPKTAVIGGNYLDPRNKGPFVPTNGAEDFLEQKTVITSGCLVDAGVASAIGGFREDYFIDQVDHEFCLRMRACGHKVAISRKPVMNHSVGENGGICLPLLGRLPKHSPLRKYYVARNSLVTIAAYWRREPGWCLRRAVRLFLGLLLMATLEGQRRSNVRAFATGFRDAILGRMGQCHHF